MHSNLKFIQLFRRQEKLVSEAAYYFTNLVSAKTFICDLDAKSLSIDETEFEENMKRAKLAITGARMGPPRALHETAALVNPLARMCDKATQNELSPILDEIVGLASQSDPGPSQGMEGSETNISGEF